MRFLLVFFVFLIPTTIAYADTFKVSSIEAFLVYGQSGKLSPNIVPPSKEIDFWNTGIGEGGAREWTNDVLIMSHFSREKGKSTVGVMSIEVKDHEKGKILFERRNVDILFAETNKASKAYIIEDIQCINLDITVAVDKVKKTVNLPFACGE